MIGYKMYSEWVCLDYYVTMAYYTLQLKGNFFEHTQCTSRKNIVLLAWVSIQHSWIKCLAIKYPHIVLPTSLLFDVKSCKQSYISNSWCFTFFVYTFIFSKIISLRIPNHSGNCSAFQRQYHLCILSSTTWWLMTAIIHDNKSWDFHSNHCQLHTARYICIWTAHCTALQRLETKCHAKHILRARKTGKRSNSGRVNFEGYIQSSFQYALSSYNAKLSVRKLVFIFNSFHWRWITRWCHKHELL